MNPSLLALRGGGAEGSGAAGPDVGDAELVPHHGPGGGGAAAAGLEVNSIALLKSQQTFQQTFQQSFYSM